MGAKYSSIQNVRGILGTKDPVMRPTDDVLASNGVLYDQVITHIK